MERPENKVDNSGKKLVMDFLEEVNKDSNFFNKSQEEQLKISRKIVKKNKDGVKKAIEYHTNKDIEPIVGVKNKLSDVSNNLNELIKEIRDISKIEGDEVDLTLKKIEGRVDLLRELVDFRMGRID